MFRHWHNGVGLEARRYNCLGKEQVENVCEDASKLLSTCSEHMSQDALRAGSLVCVDCAPFLMYICGGEWEGLVDIRGFSFGRFFFLLTLSKLASKSFSLLRKDTLMAVCVELLGL